MNYYKMHYEIAKTEVAREIFEEIDNLMNWYLRPSLNNGVVEVIKEPFLCIDPSDLKKLKKKYVPGINVGNITAAEAIANFHEAAHEYGDFLRKLDKETKAKTDGALEAFDASHTDGNKVSSGDICVVCGESVPEGRQVCGMCETGQEFLEKRKE